MELVSLQLDSHCTHNLSPEKPGLTKRELVSIIFLVDFLEALLCFLGGIQIETRYNNNH